ncbi:MAG TPA: hypothetical protein VMU84_15065, partial [Thermoanaerobaculia bacterium]|nr:hypothetical protein [Thermoanaerobaculia bacterium]
MADIRHRLVPSLALLLAAALSAQEQPAPVPAPAPVPEQPTAQAAATTNEEFEKAAFFGKKFFELKEYASAYEQFAKADQLRPDQPAVLYDMAVVLAKAGRYLDAQVKVERYLRLYPQGAEKPLIGKLQLELDFQRVLQKKRQEDQDYSDLFSRAKYLYGKNDLDGALKLFVDAEQARANDPAAVYNQAVIFERRGDYAKAVERYRRYEELETDADEKASVEQRVYALETEIEDMKSKLVCSFCGQKLSAGATWCHRCWHGPYLVKSPVWNTRACAEGASVTRTTYFSDNRFNRNDALPCIFASGSMLEALRYTPARQRSIQEARKAEGWTYDHGVIQGLSDQVHFEQGPDYLRRATSPSGGDILLYLAHSGGDAIWLLDREDLVIDAQEYTSFYTYDANGRIAQQRVEYQNGAACNHLITETADFVYQNDALASVKLKGGYDGYPAEGSPQTSWEAAVAYTYDDKARVTKEELSVTSLSKTYSQKPAGALRDETNKIYTGMRV